MRAAVEKGKQPCPNIVPKAIVTGGGWRAIGSELFPNALD
jgi:hypothetical protein